MNHEEIGEGDFEIQVDNWKKWPRKVAKKFEAKGFL